MLLAAHCVDKPNSADLRAATRDSHLAWLEKHLGKILVGGPYLAADGVTITGSFMLIEAPDEATARAMFADEPFIRSGLFESIDIRPFRWATTARGACTG